ncbi:SGNH/GDSL hydrolase family protein, partial [archaeon]
MGAVTPESGQHHPFQLSQLLLKLNETLDPIVDATPYQMHSAYHRGNYCPFRHKVVAKMLRGEPVNIMIVGGSVTWGAELRDRNNQRWSNSFTNILKSSWYNGTINVHNIAVGACNIDTWIYKVNQLSSADMMIMDLSVNDQGFDLQALPHLYRTFIQLVDRQPNHPAMLFHLAYRTGLRNPGEIQGHCPAANQSITCCNGVVACKRWWEMSDYVARVLHEYKIPYISYKELTWPVLESPPPILDQYWNGLSHPDYKAHALMAKLIAFGFYMNLKQSVHA